MVVGLRSACCAVVLAFLAAGCGGGAAKLTEGSHQVAHSAGLGTRRIAVVRCATRAAAAVVRQEAVVRAAPDARARMVAQLDRLDENGFRTVVGVIGVRCGPDWYRVRLSVLPNGTTGWVRAWAVQPYRVQSRIVVDLSQRRLRLYRSGRVALETPVSIGSAATPTPAGRFFVNERYAFSDASGPFGPDALGISAHSVALQNVWAEHGPIAIHGTDEPWSIGEAASHGCIRIANDVMRRLFPLAPAGTPVVVRP